MSEEAASANTLAAERFVEILKAVIGKEGYSAKQIFNVERAALC